MDLRLDRKEIVAAIGDYAKRQISDTYAVAGVKLDGNGQGATVSLEAERIEPDSPVVLESESPVVLDTKDEPTETKSKPTATETAKAKAKEKAAKK